MNSYNFDYALDHIEKLVRLYINKPEITLDEFKYHHDDKNTINFIVTRFNELKTKYNETEDVEEKNDILIRACMIFSGLLLFEYDEDE